MPANDDLYSRQEPLELRTSHTVSIIGLGGVGSWVAIFCAMSGVHQINLYDPDILEESNRNRLPFCNGAVGQPKVEVVSNYIGGIRPACKTVPYQIKAEGLFLEEIARVSEIIFECTDSPKSQIETYIKCKERAVYFIRAGYDGTHITVTSTVSGWIDTTEEEAPYTIQPSWVVPSAIVGALAVAKAFKYFNQEVSIDISEIGIPMLQKRRRVTARCRERMNNE